MMTDSRKSILARLGNIPAVESLDLSEIRTKLSRKLQEQVATDGEMASDIFQKELIAADGEVIRLNQKRRVAESIKIMMNEGNYSRIIISAEPECREVAAELKSISNLEIVDASDIQPEDRKEKIAVLPVALVWASYAIAETGSVVFLYDEIETCYPHFLAETVFILLNSRQIMANQFALYEKLPESKTKNMVFVTGPSRTADIEKIIILGAHGPKRVVVFLVD